MKELINKVNADVLEIYKSYENLNLDIIEKETELNQYENKVNNFVKNNNVLIPCFDQNHIKAMEHNRFQELREILINITNKISDIDSEARGLKEDKIALCKIAIDTKCSELFNKILGYDYGDAIHEQESLRNELFEKYNIYTSCINDLRELSEIIQSDSKLLTFKNIVGNLNVHIEDGVFKARLNWLKHRKSECNGIINRYNDIKQKSFNIKYYLEHSVYSNINYNRDDFDRFLNAVKGNLNDNDVAESLYDYSLEDLSRIVKSAKKFIIRSSERNEIEKLFVAIKREINRCDSLIIDQSNLINELLSKYSEFNAQIGALICDLDVKLAEIRNSVGVTNENISNLRNFKEESNYESLISIINEYSVLSSLLTNFNIELTVLQEKVVAKLKIMKSAFEKYQIDKRKKLENYAITKAIEIIDNKMFGETEEKYIGFEKYFNWNNQYIREREAEDIVVGWYKQELALIDTKPLLGKNQFIKLFLNKLMEKFSIIRLEADNHYFFKVPYTININGGLENNTNLIIKLSSHNDVDEQKKLFFRHLVISLMKNIPAGKCDFRFYIPKSTDLFSIFSRIGKDDGLGRKYVEQLHETIDISNSLDEIRRMIAERSSSGLVGGKSLFEVNVSEHNTRTPYTFLFVSDYPDGLTEQGLEDLEYIYKQGPKYGVYTFIFNHQSFVEYRFSEGEDINKKIKTLNDVLEDKTIELSNDGFAFIRNKKHYVLESNNDIEWEEFKDFVAVYNEDIKKNRVISCYFKDINSDMYIENGEFKIPVGINLNNEIEYLSFVGSTQHYLIIGSTRSGKSNLLNVIVLNTLKYIKDSEVYLVDFKEGVSFAPFVESNQKGLKIIAAANIPMVGEKVLEYVAEDIIRNISEELTNEKVVTWQDYYQKTGKLIPVRLLIIDEYHNLYRDKNSKATEYLEKLIREAANCNVHIILSSQTTGGFLPNELLNQINGKIAFFNNNEDEYRNIFSSDLPLAKELNNDNTGQFVFSLSNKDKPRLVQAAYIENLAQEISVLDQKTGYKERYVPLKIFVNSVEINYHSFLHKVVNSNEIINSNNNISIGNDIWIREDGYSEFTIPMRMEGAHFVNSNDILLYGDNKNNKFAERLFLQILYSVLANIVIEGYNKKILVLAANPQINKYIDYLVQQLPEYVCNRENDINNISALSKYSYIFVYEKEKLAGLSYQTLFDIIKSEDKCNMPSIVMHIGSFSPNMVQAVKQGRELDYDAINEKDTFMGFNYKLIFSNDDIALKYCYPNFNLNSIDKNSCKYIGGPLGNIDDVWPYNKVSDNFVKKLVSELQKLIVDR